MHRRPLPGTDLTLSVVGMGCWPLGGEYWGPTDEAAAIAAVHTALDVGIDWFDTAPLYGKGHGDEVLARALGSRIHDVVLATKVGARLDGVGPDGADGHAHSDLRPEHLVADCEASLRRLKEPLDLLQVHWPCEWGTALEDTAAALDQLVDRGWIRHWGVCNYDAPSLLRLREAGRPVTLQTGYSLLRREFEGALQQAASGMGVLAYEALVRGLLTGKFTHPPRFGPDDLRAHDPRFTGRAFAHGRAVARDLGAIGRKVGVDAAACALGWVASRPGVTAVIAGCRTPDQVRANAKGAAVAANPKVVDVIDRAVQRHGPPPR